MKCEHTPVLPRGSYLWPWRRQAGHKTCKCRKCGASIVLKNYSRVRWIWFFSCFAVYVLYCVIEYLHEYLTRCTYPSLGEHAPFIIFLVPIILLAVISVIAEHIILPRLPWEDALPRSEPEATDIERGTRGQQLMEEYGDTGEKRRE